MNFRDFRVFAFGYRSQNENPEITENFSFLVFSSQAISNRFLCIYLFLVVDNAITLFNYFFRDFRGFRDIRNFRGFDLAGVL